MLRLREGNCDAKALGWAWRSYKVTVRHLYHEHDSKTSSTSARSKKSP